MVCIALAILLLSIDVSVALYVSGSAGALNMEALRSASLRWFVTSRIDLKAPHAAHLLVILEDKLWTFSALFPSKRRNPLIEERFLPISVFPPHNTGSSSFASRTYLSPNLSNRSRLVR